MLIKIGKYGNFSLILLRMIRFIFILITCSFFIVSCKKEGCTDSQANNYNPNANEDDGSCTYTSDILQLDIDPKYGAQSFYLDSVYQTTEGYLVKFTEIKFYISELKNGIDTLCKAALFDLRETDNFVFSSPGDFSQYQNLSGNIGIDSLINHSDPSTFDNESPLNISNAGLMHWGWNPGYIFINIQGKVDTLANGNNFDHNFVFHVGTDSFKKTFALNNLVWTPMDNGSKLVLKLDLNTFLNNNGSTIDLKQDFFTHSGSDDLVLTEKLATNFLNALTP